MNPSEKLTSLLIQAIKKKIATKPNSRFLLAISGGTSPLSLFRLWTGKYRNKIDWNNIELFWVDERCVPPEDSESNFGTARKMLLENVPMPETHVHRIKGEDEPFAEAGRYGKLVCDFWKDSTGFDMVILGIGSDGHTSSIFPGQKHLLNTDRIYEESVNPYSGQKRIALTAKGILNSANLYFFISGPEKEKIMSVISDNYGNPMYPAGYIMKEASNPMIFWENTGVEPFIIHGIINKMHNVQIVSS